MAIKLDALTSWILVGKDRVLNLKSDATELRRVRFDLNCEDETRVYVAYADGKTGEVVNQFVAACLPGLETVEFFAAGDLTVSFIPSVPEGQNSQVWLWTAELEPNVSEVPDAVSFTEPWQRRARNPELEMMQFIARQNERRMDERIAKMESLIKEGKPNVDAKPAVQPAGATGEKPVGDPTPASGENKPGASEQPGDDSNVVPA